MQRKNGGSHTNYEGISGYEAFRNDLALMYLADVDPADGDLRALKMASCRICRFQLVRAAPNDADWLQQTLDRESGKLATTIALSAQGRLVAQALQVRESAMQ